VSPAYTAPDVAAVLTLYGGLVDASAWTRPAVAQLSAQAERLAAGHQRREPGAKVVLANWHPRLIGRSADQIWAADLAAEDFRLALTNEHGYPDWAAVIESPGPSPSFEAAVEAVVDGDLPVLHKRLADRPALATARSHWGHRATLLHYLTANGVEIHRQRVSAVAPQVARLLLGHGADPTATANMYGSGKTPMDMLLTSGHPRAAGVTDELARVLS
jgi:hypothetical protein